MRFMGVASTVAAVGLLAGGGVAAAATATAEAPAASTTAVAPAAFSSPADNVHRWDRDHGRSWDGNRRTNDGWDGRPWRFWHDRGISAALCQAGRGHDNRALHRCAGGRFDGFRIG